MPKLMMKNLAQSLCFKKFLGLETPASGSGILHHSAGSIYHTGSSLLCHGQCCCLRLSIRAVSFFLFQKLSMDYNKVQGLAMSDSHPHKN